MCVRRGADFSNTYNRINPKDHRMEARVLVAGLQHQGVLHIRHMFDNDVVNLYTIVHSYFTQDQAFVIQIYKERCYSIEVCGSYSKSVSISHSTFLSGSFDSGCLALEYNQFEKFFLTGLSLPPRA